jgi:hypothetical protein
MSEEEVLHRLDLIQATLQLAFRPQIESAREAIRADDVNAAILDETADWIASKALQDKVAAKTKKTDRTVRNRLAELVEQRVLAVRGSARPEYRRTGLI